MFLSSSFSAPSPASGLLSEDLEFPAPPRFLSSRPRRFGRLARPASREALSATDGMVFTHSDIKTGVVNNYEVILPAPVTAASSFRHDSIPSVSASMEIGVNSSQTATCDTLLFGPATKGGAVLG
ncbi:hypothetical protein [Verrucomicrobium sp. GAS474]|uniref:hypothetical protein n=1 Tax=Verrucomicrobium sp. GAS474 TaxID=1882831 RepID=UPI0012FF5B69|nr:hypothetical protein [Verrucomicrobium sp. GAS474]